MSLKNKLLEDITKNEYIVDGGTVASMMDVLLEIILAFLSAEEAKARIDLLTATQANEIAEELEDAKFGPKKN